MVVSYALLNASRFIVNSFDKRVTPYVYQLTDKGSVVLKKDYEDLKKERDTLISSLEKERERAASYEMRYNDVIKESEKEDHQQNEYFSDVEFYASDLYVKTTDYVDDLDKSLEKIYAEIRNVENRQVLSILRQLKNQNETFKNFMRKNFFAKE